MSLSSDVVVSADRVTFPERCVVCGSDPEGQAVELRANPSGFYGIIPWILGRTRSLKVPAHEGCGKKLRRVILVRNLSLLILTTAGIIIALALGLGKWEAIAVAVLGLMIPILWQVFRPVAFEYTHGGGEFKLLFREREYAEEVAALNDGILVDFDEEDDGAD